ncbi:MAG: ADP-glyceromanno-heptose 6-epimerase [Alphaproteobacteria bacterium]
MIVITGGAGFIGSNLVAALSDRGERDLVVCDRLGRGDKWHNLAKHEVAEIVPPEELMGFLDSRAGSVDGVVHMGAVTSTTERDVDRIMRDNFGFSLAVWRWCSAHQVRLIYASSAATYGDGSQGFDDDGSVEALARLQPLNAYGWSKHVFDRRVVRLVADRAPRPPQWVGLKFFNVYGPNEYHKEDMRSIVHKAFAEAVRGNAVTLFKSHDPRYPDGGQMRDFVWVKDCVDVITWLLDNPEVNGLFNLGSGKARTFADIGSALFRALGKEPRISYVDTPAPLRDQYQYFTEARMDRLRAAGYDKPFRALEEGVAEYVHDYLSRPDPYA